MWIVGHSGNNCPETHKEATFINKGFHQLGNNKWNNQSCPQGNSNYKSNYNLNQPSFQDLVLSQAKINEHINKKLLYNEKMPKNRNTKIEGLTSYINNQMSFNKMIETQIAQLAVTIHVSLRKILRQPETSLESIKIVSMRSDKPLCQKNHIDLVDPPFIAKKEDPGRPTNTCSIGPHVF